jgi:uncharacterized membrane protein YedE/YeeE
MEIILKPWAWYISGPLIALVMFTLILLGKNFGMSANLRTICTVFGAKKNCDFFDFDWKAQKWNLLVATGAIVGGFIGANYLSRSNNVNISSETVVKLQKLGIENAGEEYLPSLMFSTNALTNPKTLAILVVGGFLIGFGSRYAGGCTSGHAISGLSNLQLPSLIAVIGFFIGGLVMAHFILPLIF